MPNRRRGDEFYKSLTICCMRIEQRYVVIILLAFGILFSYMQRICFYIALVEMTKRVRARLSDYGSKEVSWERCPPIFLESLEYGEGMFKDWSDKVQGQLLASFSLGYVFTCLLGGYIADKYGAKQIFGASVVLTSLCSILTPLVALIDVGPKFVMVVRIFMGFVQGPMFPAATSMVTKWSPRHQRAFLSAIANSAVPLSIFLGNLLATTIITNLTWHWVFVIFSVFGFFWYFLWQVFVFSTPRTHRFIKTAEKELIEYSIQYDSPDPVGGTPLMEIIKSPKFHAVTYANFGFDWGFCVVSMELPFYLRNVLNFPIMEIGVVSAMPWLGMWIGAVTFGYLSHFLISQGIIRKIQMRRLMAVLSTIVPALLLILASWASCSHVLVCLLFSVCMFYAGAAYSGIRLSVMDMAPNYAGVTMSLINVVGSIAGFLVPMFVHNIAHRGGTLMQWKISFWIAAIFMVGFSIPYLCHVTTAVQPWNMGSTDTAADVVSLPEEPHPGPSTRRWEDYKDLPFRSGISI